MFDFPSTIDPAVRKHIESFYHSADAEDTTAAWANHFTPDGIAKKSPEEVKGRGGKNHSISRGIPRRN